VIYWYIRKQYQIYQKMHRHKDTFDTCCVKYASQHPLLTSLEAHLAHYVSKKGWGIFETCKSKYRMLHLWLIVLHLRQLCHIVCHIWLCTGNDLYNDVTTDRIYSQLIPHVREVVPKNIFFCQHEHQAEIANFAIDISENAALRWCRCLCEQIP
jgi:hypothetical protein